MSDNNIVSNSSLENDHKPIIENNNDEINPELLKFKHSDIYNIKCFECDSSNADYVSINNSIFLCEKCYNIHKNYNIIFSEVRPLTDSFSEDEINLILQGGNKRLNDFLIQYKIPKNSENKYFLYALDYYRKLLRSESFGEDFPEKPDSVSAFKIIEINEEIKNEEVKKNNFLNKFGNFIKNKANSIKKKINEIKEKRDKTEENGNKNESLYKKTTNKIGIKIKNLVNEFKEKRNKKKLENKNEELENKITEDNQKENNQNKKNEENNEKEENN